MANQRDKHNVEEYIHRVTTLSLTIGIYLYSFSSWCLPSLRNSERMWTYSSSRSYKVI